MLIAALLACLVYLAAFAAIALAAARVSRRFGLDPRDVLVWFGLAERASVHGGRQRRSVAYYEATQAPRLRVLPGGAARSS